MPQGNKSQSKSQKPKQSKANKKPKQQVRAPVALGAVVKVAGPRFKPSKGGSTCIVHEELLGDVVGTESFTVVVYRINPGLSSFSAWLAGISPNYESYKFKRLRFKFVPTCPTSQAGAVYLTGEFDPQDPAPTSERQIASYDGTVFGAVWARHDYNVAARNLNKRTSYFVRNGTVPNADLPLYDVGYVVIGTTGVTGEPTIGKLWLEYEVELTTPQLNNLAVGNSQSLFISGTDNFVTNPTPVGNAPLIVSAAGGTLSLRSTAPYQALFAFNVGGTSLPAAPATGGTATAVPKAILSNAGATSSVAQYLLSFNEGDTFTLAFTGAAAVNGYFLRFGQYNVLYG